MVSEDHRRGKMLLGGLLVALAATALVNCRLGPPRHGWSRRWGPLVSHKTFPGDCGICHVTGGWDILRKDFSFDHEKQTGHALKGAHASASCLRCHNDRGPAAAYAARGCGGCHPDPHTSSLGSDCQRCHGEINWRPTGLIAEHARTRFALFGAHAVAPCELCHPGTAAGQFRGAPIECDLCHRTDLARVTSPNHVASGWTTDCQRCHTPLGWERAFVRHDFFSLSGGHAGLDCTRCHTSGVMGRISSDCYSCHADTYQMAPNHVAGGFPHTCEQCHSITGWSRARYDHTGFALTGAHAALSCAHCHTNGRFDPLPTDCYSCHAANYQTAPGHVAQDFPHTCDQCHSTSGWSPARYDHSGFALTGAHAALSCNRCHTNGRFDPLPTDCYSCHAANYQGAANHAALNFPHTCQQCHTTTAWLPSTFRHRFPLSGPHNRPCADCHTTGSASSFSCVDCHAASETNGKHREVSGYSYTSAACYRCHPSGRGD